MDHDPRDTFAADQAAAATEEQTREEQSWALNVAQSQAQALHSMAAAGLLEARAGFWKALAHLVSTIAWLALLGFVAFTALVFTR